MNVTESKQGDAVVLKVEGRLDAVVSAEFEKTITRVIGAGGTRLVLDCSALAYVSSAGLRAFLSAAKQLKALRGKLALADPTPQVREILDLAGFSAILTVCPTMDEALKTVNS